MQVNRTPNPSLFSRVAKSFQKPEGPGEQMTGRNLSDDITLFVENSATLGASLMTGLTASTLTGGGAAGMAAGGAGMYVGYQASKIGNLVGNLVSKATGSARAGRITRAAVKSGLFIGGVAALGGSVGTGLIAFATAGVVFGLSQIVADDAKAIVRNAGYGQEPKAGKTAAPENLLDSKAPLETEASNLLSATAPLESEARNLLQQSNLELGKLNGSTSPKVLLQTH